MHARMRGHQGKKKRSGDFEIAIRYGGTISPPKENRDNASLGAPGAIPVICAVMVEESVGPWPHPEYRRWALARL